MGIPVDTYSLTVDGATVDNSFQPQVIELADRVVQSAGCEQQAMRLNTPFYMTAPDGSQVLCVFDAERSIPGVSRIVRRL